MMAVVIISDGFWLIQANRKSCIYRKSRIYSEYESKKT